MDKTALGAFQMVRSERVRDTAEFESIQSIERSRIEGDNAVPAALDWDWLIGNYCVARSL